MKLIVNGDDLGYTMGISYGIVEGYKKGILRSTTALCNSDYLVESKQLCDNYPGLGIGVHLTCTLGKSLTKNKTLTDEKGNFFPGRTTIWSHDVDYDELYLEWKAQIEKYISVFGHLPTHLDSHHSVHDATPQALQVSQRLAKEYNLPMRRYSNYKFIGTFFGPKMTNADFIKVLQDNKDTDIEVMLHPAFVDLDLYTKSSYSLGRINELAIICSDEIKQYVKEHNIELGHY